MTVHKEKYVNSELLIPPTILETKKRMNEHVAQRGILIQCRTVPFKRHSKQ